MKILKAVFKIILIFIIFLILVKGGIAIYLNSSKKLEITNANNIMLYDKDNKLFFQGNKSKEWVPLKKISKNVINATIYTEDKNFYKHDGFDYLRIVKAGITNIINKKTSQGASTITQQYAKNLFLDFDKTWKRKWDEMWYTMKIENDYSKDEILEGYLNTINYGHGMYGIENASQFYFNKSSKDLDLAEASIIVGIPKSPSNYSPLVDFKTAKKRQVLVLEALVNNNIISEEEKENAYNEELNIIGKKTDEIEANIMYYHDAVLKEVKNKIITEEEKNKAYNEELKIIGKKTDEIEANIMYYHDAVLKELKTIDGIPKSLNDTSGLKIYTTLDEKAQTNLEENIKNNIPEESKVQASSVMMNPNNGEIIALVGGRNYNESSYNRVTDSKRQVGSTMKPYLYYTALENGFTSSTTFTSEKTTFNFPNGLKYTPKNNNDTYGNKPISMATAVAYSENIYAVKTHLFLGEDMLIDTARKVGITSKLEKIPSLPLGTNEINIIEMASGYSAFANLGYKVKPHLIKKIEDKDGNVLYEYKNEKTPVLNKSICFILNNILTSTYDKDFVDYNYPTALGIASKMTHKYALKSGTTSTDNWNIGYNKNILTAVWIGYDDNTELKPSEYKYSQNIWLNSMENYLQNKNDDWYDMPENVSSLLVNPITGKPATENDEKKKIMYFIKGTEPTDTDTVFDEKIENATLS